MYAYVERSNVSPLGLIYYLTQFTSSQCELLASCCKPTSNVSGFMSRLTNIQECNVFKVQSLSLRCISHTFPYMARRVSVASVYMQ